MNSQNVCILSSTVCFLSTYKKFQGVGANILYTNVRKGLGYNTTKITLYIGLPLFWTSSGGSIARWYLIDISEIIREFESLNWSINQLQRFVILDILKLCVCRPWCPSYWFIKIDLNECRFRYTKDSAQNIEKTPFLLHIWPLSSKPPLTINCLLVRPKPIQNPGSSLNNSFPVKLITSVVASLCVTKISYCTSSLQYY